MIVKMNKKQTPVMPARECGGAGCGILLLIASLCALMASGLAYQHGPYWYRTVLWRPPGVIIHHTATPAIVSGQIVDRDLIDSSHARRGFLICDGRHVYHIGYHYLILPDGTVQNGRPEWLPGAHCMGANNYIGICLVGNFSSEANPTGAQQPARPTEAQLSALRELLQRLAQRYKFTAKDIYGHRDFRQTECPGDRFPMERVRGWLAQKK